MGKLSMKSDLNPVVAVIVIIAVLAIVGGVWWFVNRPEPVAQPSEFPPGMPMPGGPNGPFPDGGPPGGPMMPPGSPGPPPPPMPPPGR